MTPQPDQAAWRDRVLKELYEHPEISRQDWVADLLDEELELLLTRVRSSEELQSTLDDLQRSAQSRDT